MINMTAQELINNAGIILQKTGDPRHTGITKPTEFDGIEQVLVFRCEHNGLPAIARPTDDYLDKVGVDVDAMWEAGLEHVREGAKVLNFAEMFGSADIGMKALTFKTGAYGAAAILAADKLLDPGVYYAIPSSIHEFIVLPYGWNGFDDDEIADMIQSINAAQVEEHEQLGDRAYRLEVR